MVCLVTLGCDPKGKPANTSSTFTGKPPIRAAVTVGMVADLVKEIGGEHVQVQQLLGAGVDPHLYKPSRDDVQALLRCDVIFYSGLMLEGKMAETLERLNKTKPTLAVGEQLTVPAELAPHGHDHPDPHVWMDVSLWRQAAQTIGEYLSKYDPPHANDYQTRAKALEEQLDRLHKYGLDVMSRIPKERRVLITSHDAFRYFGHAYGLEVQALQGISTESEAGLQRINELVDLLVNRKIEAVFVESSVPKESIEALLEGARARGQKVEIGGELFSDAMGNAGTPEGTYIGMMDHNLSTIAKALGATEVNGFSK